MLYLKLNINGQPEKFPLEERHIRTELAYVTLPDILTDEVLNPHGYALLHNTGAELPQATKTHRVIISDCVKRSDDTWGRVYTLEEITDENIRAAREDRKWAELRAHRDFMMTDLSWRLERNAREERMGLPLTDDRTLLDQSMQNLADMTKLPDPFLINLEELVVV